MTRGFLTTRAGVTGEDFLDVIRDEQTGRVVISADGGLSRVEMSLNREEAEQLRNALTAYLATN